jgi:hypothetical protein
MSFGRLVLEIITLLLLTFVGGGMRCVWKIATWYGNSAVTILVTINTRLNKISLSALLSHFQGLRFFYLVSQPVKSNSRSILVSSGFNFLPITIVEDRIWPFLPISTPIITEPTNDWQDCGLLGYKSIQFSHNFNFWWLIID